MADLAKQQRDIDRSNRKYRGRFRLIKGIEANILADGSLDLSAGELARIELVVAAPHSVLRSDKDQTARMIAAVQTRGAAECLFALDSDAHAPPELRHAETAIAHARLAGVPAERVINCWPVERLLNWLAASSTRRR